jgi:bifunctional non-homologous end joining protein LigD
MSMQPIVPFEPISTDQYPEGPNWVAQVKWDGVRVLTYYDGRELKLFNRKLNERTFHYPELSDISEYCMARSVILDGEIIALKDGKPSFYEVMKRDGITKLNKARYLANTIPITYMIFDILFYNDQWVTSNTLLERQKILEDIIVPNNCTHLVENFYEIKALFDVIKKQNMEGILIKDLSSIYLINGKDRRWRKKKFYKDLIAVVGGVILKNNIVNSLLLGLYDRNGHFIYIGNVGSGKFTQKDWHDFTQGIQPFIQSTVPFANKPSRLKEATWLKPIITVKIKFTDWTESHGLRQPNIQAIVNVSPEECVLE